MIYLISNQDYLFDSPLFTKISIEEAIEDLLSLSEISLDTETQGLDVFTKKLLLLQLGDFKNQYVFDVNSYNNKIPLKLVNFLNSHNATYILQNAKFDIKFLFHQGVILKRVYDTMLAEIILTNGLQYSGRDLNSLTYKYCNTFLDKSVRGTIISSGLNNSVIEYGANDIKYLSIIKEAQLREAEKLNLSKAIELDNSFVIVLAYTEYCGIKLDYEKWKLRTIHSESEVLLLKEALEERLLKDGKTKYFSGMLDMFTLKHDCILNWDSPLQVIKLFKEYGIKVTVKEKGIEKETIDAKVLIPQKKDFPILPPYLEYKEKQKEISTYGHNWKKYINPVTGRIHTTYQQLMDTSRLSSGNKRDGTPKQNWAI